MEGRAMSDRWRGNSDVFLMEASRWPPAEGQAGTIVPASTGEPDEPELSPREEYKRKLSRAWLRSKPPKYWTEPPVDPVTAVVVPAAVNPRKGSGPLTEEEIELFRALQRLEFAAELRQRWQNNVMHL
jgi:hypothetical protein